MRWRVLPTGFGARVSQEFCRELRARAAEEAKQIFADSKVVRAPAAAGPEAAERPVPGRTRGGFETKIHLAACDERTALGVLPTGGQPGDTPTHKSVMVDLSNETAAASILADTSQDSNAI